MNPAFRPFATGDFHRVRDFLAGTYQSVGKKYNWSIERWNFTVMSRIIHGVSFDEWASKIGIWEKNGSIIALVHPEGEVAGEAFFQVGMVPLPESLLEEMFTYAEKALSAEKEGRRYLQLRIAEGDQLGEKLAANRGYTRRKESEPVSEIPITESQPVKLPGGFSIQTGLELNDAEKGQAHAKAFGYFDRPELSRRAPIAYQELRKTPDYRPELDLGVVTGSGQLVSFCTMWYDTENKIGMLEPVGTIPGFRRRGLARAVIQEALNRIFHKGATRAYVGSDQSFYLAIGFKQKYCINIWEKVLD